MVVVVNLVGRIARLVIVLMRARPEEQHGNLFSVKRRMIAWSKAIFVHCDLKPFRRVAGDDSSAVAGYNERIIVAAKVWCRPWTP